MRKNDIFAFVQCLVLFFISGVSLNAQYERVQSGFTFIYNGPDAIYVDEDCIGILDWGHPNSVSVTTNDPGAVIVSFFISSISGGYSIGDTVPVGETIIILYTVTDNMGNGATFGISLPVLDTIPPQFNLNTLPPDITLTCGETPGFPLVQATDNCEDTDNPTIIQVDSPDYGDGCTPQMLERVFSAEDASGNVVQHTQLIYQEGDTVPPLWTNFPQNGTGNCITLQSDYASWLATQIASVEAVDFGCGIDSIFHDGPDPDQVSDGCNTINVVFSAVDICGNTNIHEVIFNANDMIAPEITVQAGDASTNCDNFNSLNFFNNWVANRGGAEASDNCGDVFWSTIPENPSLSGNCAEEIIVEFIAEDGCGNVSSTSATFSFIDTIPPAFVNPPMSLVLSCQSNNIDDFLSAWIDQQAGAIVEDYCTASEDLDIVFLVDWNVTDSAGIHQAFTNSTNGLCQDSVNISGQNYNNVIGHVTVGFEYFDVCNNTLLEEASFAIVDLDAPVISDEPITVSYACDNEDLDSLFTDWYNQNLGLSVEDNCSNTELIADIDLITALDSLQIYKLTPCDFANGFEIEIIAYDNCGMQSQPVFAHFIVTDTINPEITQLGMDKTVSCEQSIQDSLSIWIQNAAFSQGIDNCGDALWTSFTFTDSLGTEGSGNVHSGPYPNLQIQDCNAIFYFEFSLEDGCGNSSTTMATFTIIDHTAPVFENPTNLILSCEDPIAFDDSLIFDYCSAFIDVEINEVSNQGIDPSQCDYYSYSISREIIAIDACGNMDTLEQTLSLSDVLAPSFIVPENITVSCTDIDDINITGSPSDVFDNCDVNPTLFYQDSIIGIGCNYIVERTWIGSDACSNVNKKIQIIHVVDDQAPSLTIEPEDVILSCDQNENPVEIYDDWILNLGNAIAVDDCGFINSFAAIPGSYNPDDTTTFPGIAPDSLEMIDCPSIPSQILVQKLVDFVFYDNCGNVLQHQASFTIVDSIAPDIEFCPGDFVLPASADTCGLKFEFPEATFTENCFEELVKTKLIINDVLIEEDIQFPYFRFLDVGEFDVQYQIEDCAGNFETCIFSISVIDEIVPLLDCPVDIVLAADTSCTALYTINIPENIDDNCGMVDEFLSFRITGATDVDWTLIGDTINPPEVTIFTGENTIEYRIEDVNGNENFCTQVVTVKDNIKPIIICKPALLQVHPSGLLPLTLNPADVDDGSFDNCGNIELTVSPDEFDCSNIGQEIEVMLYGTDASGNTDSCATVVKINPFNLQPSYSLSICDNDTLKLFSNPPLDQGDIFEYSWTGPNGFISNLQNPFIINANADFIGTYAVTITGFNGCFAEGQVSVTIESFNDLDFEIDAKVICNTGTAILSANAFAADVVYNWYEGTAPNGTLLGSTNDNQFVLSSLTNGEYNYYLIVSDEDCESNPSVSVSLSVIDQPIAVINNSNPEICQGNDLILGTDVLGQGYVYEWTGPNGFSSNLQYPPTIEQVSDQEAGVYILTIMVDDCISEQATSTVTVLPTPVQPEIAPILEVCEGDALSLTVDNVTDGDNYVWYTPAGLNFSTPGNTLNIQNVSQSDIGEWTVEVYYDNCPSQISEPLDVNIHLLPEIVFVQEGSSCEGDSLYLNGSLDEDFTVVWSGPNGFESDELEIFINSNPGIYTVIASSPFGCIDSASIDIQIDPQPEIISFSAFAPSCVNGVDSAKIFPVLSLSQGDFEYAWTGPGGFSSEDSIATIYDLTESNSGYYTLQVSVNGCASEIDSFLLEFLNIPDAAQIEGNNLICEGDSIILTGIGNFSGTESFLWETPSGNFTTDESEFVIPFASVNNEGPYILSIIEEGCMSSASDTFTLQINPFIESPMITGLSNVCAGDSIILTTANIPGATYIWEGPTSMTTSIPELVIFPATNQDAGEYAVQVIFNDCKSEFSEALIINILAKPDPPTIIPPNNAFCIDDPLLSISVCIDFTSSTEDAFYQWFDAITDLPISNPISPLCFETNDASAFSVGINPIYAVTILNGCMSEPSNSINLIFESFPTEEAMVMDDFVSCNEEEIAINASPPLLSSGYWSSPDLNITIANPQLNSTTISNLTIGENVLVWSLVADNSCGNFDTDTLIITIDGEPQANDDIYVTSGNENVNLNIFDNDQIAGDFSLDIVYISDPSFKGVITQQGNILTYSPPENFVGIEYFIYQICSETCPDLCADASVEIQVGDIESCKVPTIISPNGDRINDALMINCLETGEYPDNRLVVFNQWGDEVYAASPYYNNWTGTYKNENLPVGTYYFIFDLGDGSTVQKGFLILER